MYTHYDLLATHSDQQRPADFAEFWQRTLDELARIPVEWERIPDAQPSVSGYRIDWIRYSSWGDTLAYGWLAVPERTGRERLPGYVWLPGYSLGNPPPGPESLYPQVATFGLNLHGNVPTIPYIHPHTQNADYITQGIDSPETYILRAMVCHALRGLRVLSEQPDIDAEKLFVGGMSQGGGLALVVAALSDTVKLCLADMPWLCDLNRALSLAPPQVQRGSRRPPDSRVFIRDYADAHPEHAAHIYETYRYFDPLSHAANIVCPTHLSAGGRDPSCRPPTIYSVYNALTCEKDMLYLTAVGHDIVPAQHDFHAKWVQRLIGEPPMPDQNETREQHVGLVETDAFEITTDGATETGKRLYADGGDGKEKEATVVSAHAGASSEAPASSGIPSAMTQHGLPGQSAEHDETPMGGRAIPGKQNVEP